MKSFKDKQGREWTPYVTFNTIHRAEREHGLDFMASSQSGQFKMADFLDLMWVACRKQAITRGLKDQERFRDEVLDEVFNDAMAALMENIQDFSRRQLGGGEADGANPPSGDAKN